MFRGWGSFKFLFLFCISVAQVASAQSAPKLTLWQKFRQWQDNNARRDGHSIVDVREYHRQKSFIERSSGFASMTTEESIIASGTEHDVTFEEYSKDISHPDNFILPDDVAVAKTLSFLVSEQTQIPILVSADGAGKTTQLKALARVLIKDVLEEGSPYREMFSSDTVLLSTTALKIRQMKAHPDEGLQAESMLNYLNALDYTASMQKRNVFLAIEDMGQLSRGHLQALRSFRPSSNYFRVMGTSNFKDLMFMRSNFAELANLTEEVRIEELNNEQVREIFEKRWTTKLQEKYRVEIPAELVNDLIVLSRDVYASKSQPSAAIGFIEKLCLAKSLANEDSRVITWEDATKLSARLTGIPFDSRNLYSVSQYMEAKRIIIQQKVRGQDRLVEDYANVWQEVLSGKPGKAYRSMAVLGPTGVGKSFSAETAALEFMGDRSRILVIDGTQFQDKHAMTALVGAAPGFISSDKTKGMLPEFLSGPGQERGWIIINELDKAHPDFVQRIMEMLERGELTGGDGKVYKLNRHLVVATSNRGANKIFNRKLGKIFSKEDMLKRIKSFSQATLKNFFIEKEMKGGTDDRAQMAPEVANRFDYWTVAAPLYEDDARIIIDEKLLSYQQDMLKDYGVNLHLSPDTAEKILSLSFTQEDGIRPVLNQFKWMDGRIKDALGKKAAINGDNISISINTERGGDSFLLVNEGTELLSRYEMASTPDILSLKNEKFRGILAVLEENLKSKVFSQDEAIHEIVKSLKSHAARPGEYAPYSAWLLGPTGNGKSEISKMLAFYLYGSKERNRGINMGEIQSNFDFKKVFGSTSADPKEMCRFEEILSSFPEGAIINLDEMSNMGSGGSKAEKEALFHQFYEMLHEGTWTSPRGDVYDLSKYIFVMTGNDGEEHFEHLENDDMRRAVQKDLQKRSVLRDILTRKGVPPAFVNRVENIIMTNSLDSATRERVALKFLNELKAEYEKEYKLDLEFAPNMHKMIAKYFIPIKDGARGGKRFTYGEISGAIADLVLRDYDSLEDRTDRLKIKVSLNNLNPVKKEWFVLKPKDLIPQFELAVEGFAGEIMKAEITEEVQGRRTPAEVADKVAVHEAGHFTQNLLLGNPYGGATHATIESRGGYGGYVRWEPVQTVDRGSVKNIILRMSVGLAGRMAQEIHGYASDVGYGGRQGSGGDLDKIRKDIYKLIAEEGLLPGFNVIPLNSEGKVDLSVLSNEKRKAIEDMSEKIFEEVRYLTALIQNDPEAKLFTRKFADLLIKHGSVDPKGMKAFLRKNRAPDVTRFAENIDEKLKPYTVSLCLRELRGG